jgi:tetratricopeptide (TPR) repeat protein
MAFKELVSGCWRSRWGRAVFLFGFAFCWRLVYLWQMASENPCFDAPVVDAQTYFQQAQQLATVFTLGDGAFWQPPLYPFFLGLLYRLFGADFYAYRLVQFALGGLSAALLYLLGRRLFSERVGLVAGALFALYGPLIYFEGELLPPVLAIFLNLGLLLLLSGPQTLRRDSLCLGAGLLLGLAASAVPSVLPFSLCAAGWLLWQEGRRGARLRRAGLFAAGVLGVIGGLTLRNYRASGDWVVLSANAGLNFYLGNNPGYEQTVRIRPGTDWYEFIQQPQQAGLERASEKSAYFWSAALAFIRQQPLAYLELLARKLWLFWQGGELRRNTDVYFARRYSPLLAGLVWQRGIAFPFGLLGPLSLLGLFLAIRARRAPLLVLFVLGYTGAVVAFFVTDRYRLPVIPPCILLACYAGAWLKERFAARQWRALAPALAVLLLLGWQLNAGAQTMPDDAQEHFYAGLACARKGLLTRATGELQAALQLDPGHYDARFKLAELEAELGERDQSLAHYRYLAEHFPLRPGPRRNLAGLYLESGRTDTALALFRELVALEPGQARSYYGLAGALRLSGRLAEAEGAYRRALELDPDHFEARYNLAYVCDLQGRSQEAEAEYRKLLERAPQRQDLRNNLGVMYLKRRAFAAAAAQFEEVLARQPNHRLACRNLAIAYEALGRYAEAVQLYQRLVDNGEEEQVHNHLARLYAKLGDGARAAQERRKQQILTRGKEYSRLVRDQVEQYFEGGLPQ